MSFGEVGLGVEAFSHGRDVGAGLVEGVAVMEAVFIANGGYEAAYG